MRYYPRYTNKGASSRKNGDLTLTPSKLADTSKLIVDSIVRHFSDAKRIQPDVWKTRVRSGGAHAA
jgi:hypothetical protein